MPIWTTVRPLPARPSWSIRVQVTIRLRSEGRAQAALGALQARLSRNSLVGRQLDHTSRGPRRGGDISVHGALCSADLLCGIGLAHSCAASLCAGSHRVQAADRIVHRQFDSVRVAKRATCVPAGRRIFGAAYSEVLADWRNSQSPRSNSEDGTGITVSGMRLSLGKSLPSLGHLNQKGLVAADQRSRVRLADTAQRIAGNTLCDRHLSSPEGMHQMRVGLRRFRAAMSLFKELIEQFAVEPHAIVAVLRVPIDVVDPEAVGEGAAESVAAREPVINSYCECRA